MLWIHRLLPCVVLRALCAAGAVEIPAAQLAHAGRYTCVAQNAAGSAHRHATLHVQGKVGEAEEKAYSVNTAHFNVYVCCKVMPRTEWMPSQPSRALRFRLQS